MTKTVYTFTLKTEDGETLTHDFFHYAAGWAFARQEARDYMAACGGWLGVVVDWEEREVDREYTIKPNGEIIWEED